MLLAGRPYDVGTLYAGHEVVAPRGAPPQHIRFLDGRMVVKVKPVQGLVGQPLLLETFVRWCEHIARTLWGAVPECVSLSQAGGLTRIEPHREESAMLR